MKKIKKLLAMIMAMTMVLGMAMTVSAAPENVSGTDFESTVTVIGLSQDVETTVKMYRYATLQHDDVTNEYSWDIEEWALPFLNVEDSAITVKDGQGTALKNEAMKQLATYEDSTKDTSIVFENVLIGGYVIVPQDEGAEYAPLFATNTYDRDNSPSEGKPLAVDKTVYAKSEDHEISKEQSDGFVQIGETVAYTVKTTFPMMKNTAGQELTEFIITDTPTGVKINENSVVVKIGGTTVTPTVSVDAVSGALTVNFSGYLEEANVGKDVLITYDAVVTATAYNNSVTGSSTTTEYEGDRVDGLNGEIILTKKDAETDTALAGAEFNVYDLQNQSIEDVDLDDFTPMNFVYDESARVYRPALESDLNPSPTVAVDANGELRIVGLDEGNYYFKETKAPSGYSINEELKLATVVAPAEGETTVAPVTVEFLDTKLASLPSTGGIGTTIFTIGGCAIMIAAAALYFVNRRKSEEN